MRMDKIKKGCFFAFCIGSFLFLIGIFLVPNLIKVKLPNYEGSAIGTLRSISTSQAQFASGVHLDQDDDGIGEYGFFQELCCQTKGRMSKALEIGYLSSSYKVQNNGIVSRYGDYYFCIYLPGAGRETIPLQKTSNENWIDEQEENWICYAWPVNSGKTGVRVFAIDVNAEVYAFSNTDGRYSGLGKIPKATAAMPADSEATSEYFVPLSAAKGMDGENWFLAGGS